MSHRIRGRVFLRGMTDPFHARHKDHAHRRKGCHILRVVPGTAWKVHGGKARIPASETMANEYIYADDMGRAADLAVTAPMPRETIFNIGNGYVTPFADVVKTVKEIAPAVDFEIEPGEPPKSKLFPLDISRVKKHLGWEPKFSLRAGFEDYLGELKRARAAGF